MPRKKKEETEETPEASLEATKTESADETKPEKAEASETTEDNAAAEPSILESIAVTIGQTVAGAVNAVAGTAADAIETVVEAVTPNSDEAKKTGGGSRAERVGVVASDKMTKNRHRAR